MKKNIEKNHTGAYAAQSAYFIILSFFPMILMLLSLIQYTSIGKADIYQLIVSFVPIGFQSFFIGIVDEIYSNTIATISLSAVVTVWSAGKSFMALNKGMNSIYQVQKKPNYLLLRIRGAVFSMIFVVLLVISLLLIVFGYSIHEIVTKYFPFLSIFTRILLSFRMVLMLCTFILFFAFLYKYLPNRKATFIEQLPGAIFASLGWYLFSYGFSIYVKYRENAFNMYGSLTTLILLMFWLYFVMYIMLIGAEINQWLLVYYENVSKRK